MSCIEPRAVSVGNGYCNAFSTSIANLSTAKRTPSPSWPRRTITSPRDGTTITYCPRLPCAAKVPSGKPVKARPPRQNVPPGSSSLHDAVDRFGNQKGRESGLGRDGEFKGTRLLVWTAEPLVREHVLRRDNPLWAALAAKGFVVQLEQGPFRPKWLDETKELWIFSGRKLSLDKRSLAAIAHGFSDNLLTRAADVTLKERRRLLLMVRETPFNLAHLRNMTAATEMGAIIFPPLPAFYLRPTSIDEMVAESVERVLALLALPGANPQEWRGL